MCTDPQDWESKPSVRTAGFEPGGKHDRTCWKLNGNGRPDRAQSETQPYPHCGEFSPDVYCLVILTGMTEIYFIYRSSFFRFVRI